MKAPGDQLTRAEARANLHPSFPCLKAPGLITLIILPDMPVARPSPGYGLRRAVAAYLQPRRVIGTRVEVVGPTYLEVAVRAKVNALPGVNKMNLREKIVAGLNEFLDPLRGGPDKSGWPFGRDVFRSEVMQVIDEVAGVDYVISLALIAGGCCEPECSNVCLAPTWLVAAGQHEIEVV
jgi:predicted phage baseplate assembly protein